jgi:hypothetical protein
MNLYKRLTSLIISFAAFSLVFPRKVDAYIDPGSGSYIIQVILAAVLGGLFAVKLYWKKIKSYFSNIFSKEKDKDDEQ